ncbi:MAG: hypothetical protein HZA52_06930 [Planctomycetes bacterium]|nr:hypothetical protein [Planctomycetota bacterium]
MTAERKRISVDERIAKLQAKIEAIKQKAERAKTKRNPALRHMSAALKAIEKAMSESEDHATRQALEEARSTLSATLALNGVLAPRVAATPGARVRRTGGGGNAEGLVERLRAHVRAHPGQRGEEIASALDTTTLAMRPSMKRLIEDGAVKTQGRNRGMRYFVGA